LVTKKHTISFPQTNKCRIGFQKKPNLDLLAVAAAEWGVCGRTRKWFEGRKSWWLVVGRETCVCD